MNINKDKFLNAIDQAELILENILESDPRTLRKPYIDIEIGYYNNDIIYRQYVYDHCYKVYKILREMEYEILQSDK